MFLKDRERFTLLLRTKQLAKTRGLASKMAQQIKELVAKSADLSSIPGTHTVEGES